MKYLHSFLFIFVAVIAQATYANPERSKSSIESKIDFLKGKIFSKYNAQLKKNPNLEGSIKAKLIISSDGSVASCNTEGSSVPSQQFQIEVCEILSNINYGGTSNKADFTYVYSLEFLSQ